MEVIAKKPPSPLLSRPVLAENKMRIYESQ